MTEGRFVGISSSKPSVFDELKEMIRRYEFYQDECRRAWKDYEALEVENERLQREVVKLTAHRRFGRR